MEYGDIIQGDWIKQTKKDIEEAKEDESMLNVLLWDIRGNKDYLEEFVRELESMEENIEDKIEEARHFSLS